MTMSTFVFVFLHACWCLHACWRVHACCCLHACCYLHACLVFAFTLLSAYKCYALQFITDGESVRQRLLGCGGGEMSSYGSFSTSEPENKVKFINTMTKEDIAVCPTDPDEMGRIVLKPGLYRLEAYGYEWEVDVPGEVLCYDVSECTELCMK